MEDFHLKLGTAITVVSVIFLLISIYLAILSLETVSASFGIKLDASTRIQLVSLATCFFAAGLILLICLATYTIMRKAL
jgi:hypothetical protein